MKKLLCIVLATTALFYCFTACETNETYEDYYVDYFDGYTDGYEDGIKEGFKDAQGYLEWEQDIISDYVNSVYNVDPYDALQMISNYADGEPIPQEDVINAIFAVDVYCSKLHEAIYSLEDEYK
jgi:hypothetical protein